MTNLVDRVTVPTLLTVASTPTTPGSIDTALLGEYLLGTWADARRESRTLMKDAAFHRDDSLNLDDQRERVLGQLRLLADASKHWLGSSSNS